MQIGQISITYNIMDYATKQHVKHCIHIQLAYPDRPRVIFYFSAQIQILIGQGNVDILPYQHVFEPYLEV